MILLLSSCSSSNNLDIKSQLIGKKWQLVDLKKGQPQLALQNEKAYVIFSSDGEISGFSSCNHFRSNFQLIVDKINISPVAMTRRYCAKSAEIEQQLISVLKQASVLSLADEQLVISDAAGNFLASFII